MTQRHDAKGQPHDGGASAAGGDPVTTRPVATKPTTNVHLKGGIDAEGDGAGGGADAAARVVAASAGLTMSQTAWFRSTIHTLAAANLSPAQLEAEALLEAGRIDFAEYRRRLAL